MAAKSKTHRKVRPPAKAKTSSGAAGGPSKVDAIVIALRTPKGASITALMKITGWQQHSVRGALAGALKKKRGLNITSTKTDGERIYRIAAGK